MKILAKTGLLAVLAMIPTPSQSTQEFLQQLVGQRFILRHYTGSSPDAEGKNLSKARGGCDVAVEVTAIAFEKSSIRLEVRNIGTPDPNTGKRNSGCANVAVFSFHINGFDMDQPRDEAQKTIGYVLQTPEAYLAALGIPWNVSPSSENESPVDISSPGVTHGKMVLSVNPYYGEVSRKAQFQGTVDIRCVIGTDGLIHDPVIEKGVSTELNKLALDAVTFVRVRPASYGGHAVAFKTVYQLSSD
jgi:hypothetical protein